MTHRIGRPFSTSISLEMAWSFPPEKKIHFHFPALGAAKTRGIRAVLGHRGQKIEESQQP